MVSCSENGARTQALTESVEIDSNDDHRTCDVDEVTALDRL